MPERQSSPGEVTARPETDRTENGKNHQPAGPEPDPGVRQNDGESAASVAVQVAVQVAGEPEAVEPGPVGPAAEQSAVEAPVADAAQLASEAGNAPMPPTTVVLPAAAAVAKAAGGEQPSSSDPDQARPRPRPRADQAQNKPAQNKPAQDDPAQGNPAPDESPTVSTAAEAARGGGPTVVARVPEGAPVQAPAPAPVEPATSIFNAWDSEVTQVIPRATEPADPPTERLQVTPAGPPTVVTDGEPSPRPRRLKRSLLIAGGVVGVLAVLYAGDLALTSGSMPRGVTVAGVSLGGLGTGEAEQRLRSEVEPRTTQPIAVTVGEASSEIDPAAAGLTLDWDGTLAQAGAQPLNPITRITSFFTEREVGVVTSADEPALAAALGELAPIVDKAPVEGSVRFEGTTPEPVNPVEGQKLDFAPAAEVLRNEWVDGGSVALPLAVLPPLTSPDDVRTAIERVARPAVSSPVTIKGEKNAVGTLAPEDIAAALSFKADPAGGLTPEINPAVVTEALKPQLAASERPGRDAALDFSSGTPVVVPSQDGRGVDYEATLKDLLAVLTTPGTREITAVYGDQPAELTTEKLNSLGITGVIGEFSTGGFAADSGQNIKRAAEQINGTVVQPGETFSLNAKTNPRDAAHGYVEAGIISDGHPDRGVGGGVSQVATTVYNAAYFAGMVDVAHKEHSFFISRYPPAREATVYDDIIDMRFRNDNPTGIMIQTVWTPTSLTVKIYGTKRYEVTSTPGPRTSPTSPNTISIPEGMPCSASDGAPGFTATDTRTLKEISTGQTRSETRTVRYNPSPKVVCGD